MKLPYLTVVFVLFLFSCNSKPSLQKYFVENSDKKEFIVLDISSSIMNIDKTKLTAEQKTAIKSFDKMNILAYKLDKNNQAQYDSESQKVAQILKGKEYQELMKIGSGKDAASFSYVGSDDNINEFVLFAKKKENGFAVVRVLGKNMNPNNIMTLLSVLKTTNLDMAQLAPLKDFIK